MKKLLILIASLVLTVGFITPAAAELTNGTILTISPGNGVAGAAPTSGSAFSMEVAPGFLIWTDISGFNNIIIGAVQPAAGSHSGPPGMVEVPNIDNPWSFFGNTGMHQTTSPIIDNGDGTLDLTGWGVTWNAIPNIPMGGDPANFPSDTGRAAVTVSGTGYTLDYSAHAPLGNISGFGGVLYSLHLEGNIVTDTGDIDNDGILNADDNCVSNPNPNQADTDDDGFGDVCDVEECDGIDNDGDGFIDEGFDSDSDGIADCFDTEECDGLDNNGDGLIDEGFDTDGDGFTSCGGDCDDTSAAIYPGAPEISGNGIDDNCDGEIDNKVEADLPVGTVLTIESGNSSSPVSQCSAGSCFSMEVSPGFFLWTNISGNDGILLGQIQPASGSHSGPPNGSENEGIDNAWSFFGNTGLHQTTNPITDNGDGTVDMTGWNVTWNNIPSIPMGGDTANFPADTGVGDLTVSGSNYTIDYSGHVPVGNISGFGGVQYRVILKGTVSLPADSCAGVVCDQPGPCEAGECVNGSCVYTSTCAAGQECVDNVCTSTTVCEDSDGDGFDDVTCGGTDCDDTNSSVYPGALEISGNGIDDNCDGEIDNADPALFPIGSLLTIEPGNSSSPVTQCQTGSCFSMETSPNFYLWTNLSPGTDGGIILGQTQLASGSHMGPPNNTETGPIDAAWSFFSNTGMHGTSIPIVDTGAGILDMTGWYVTWNAIPQIPMGGDPANFPTDSGLAAVTVSGTAYTLDYSAHVPVGSPSDFGGVLYTLHLEGNIDTGSDDMDGDGVLLPDDNCPFTANSDQADTDGDGTGDACDVEECDGLDNDGDGLIDEGFDYNGNGIADCFEVFLPGGTLLTIERGNSPSPVSQCPTGSCFSMETSPGFFLWTNIAPGTDGGILLGQIQTASGSHTGPIEGPEIAPIDAPWSFFSNTGMHGTSIPIVDTGAGILDMTGWYVTWNAIPQIPMGGDPANFPADSGLATVTVSGIAYTLDYSAHVPLGSPSGFGGVRYTLHLEGTVFGSGDDPDGDGVLSGDDNCPFTANPDQADTDGDGTGDACDVEECDGLDNDGDGLIDEGFDSDGDGIADCFDVEECDGLDNDGDGRIDEGFPDTDGDKIADCLDVEECDGLDNDGNGQIDEGFSDTDSDGTADCVDNCPLDFNPDQADQDSNGIGDECDADTDGDGYNAIASGGDDCDDTNPQVFPGAIEIPGNGVDDNCDGEIDNAGPALIPVGSLLTIEPGNSPSPVSQCPTGSCFSMETSPGFYLWTNIAPGTDGGILLGQMQTASGSHTGPIEGPEIAPIDAPWSFFGNTGMHGTSIPIVDTGPGILDMSGWYVTWNAIPQIPMGGDAANFPSDSGLATVTVSGTDYTLDYSAHVPLGSPSGFGGVLYTLHLEGDVFIAGDDVDGDGVFNDADNCPFEPNPEQADTDGDGIGDTCDVEECDGLDNDGDGLIDEGFDSDGDGIADCFDVEECDGLDNDGDGRIDEGFLDTDRDRIADCIDVEECDGLDNDGNGQVDEGFADSDGDGIADCVDSVWGVDDDGDGHGSIATGGDDCDDTNPQTYTGALEIPGNGIDDNCDGEIDNADPALIPIGSLLTIEPGGSPSPVIQCTTGSCFSMETAPGFYLWTNIAPGTDGGIIMGQTQKAYGSHTGPPKGTEIDPIDAAWSFFGNTGMHGTSIPIVDFGGGVLDMSGWYITWNSIPQIPMGGDPANFPSDSGLASVTVSGTAYTLDYSAHVPVGSPSGFGGVLFTLHLEGTVELPIGDSDIDGDGIFDLDDNCIQVPNPDQTDTDNDGIGDACDPIPDGGSLLPDGTLLTIEGDSQFSMEVSPGFSLLTDVSSGGDGGLVIGEIQDPGSIDATWSFFGSDGTHYTTSPFVIDENGNVDFTGWTVFWDGIEIPLAGKGQFTDNGDGTYTITFTTNVPVGNPSGFGGVSYSLYLSGFIIPPPDPCDIVQDMVDESCPIDGDYKNHGQYVVCVGQITKEQLDLGTIGEECSDGIMEEAGSSNVGKKVREK